MASLYVLILNDIPKISVTTAIAFLDYKLIYTVFFYNLPRNISKQPYCTHRDISHDHWKLMKTSC